MALGERISALRKQARWSQGELGHKIRSDGRRISRYEAGRITLRRRPRPPRRDLQRQHRPPDLLIDDVPAGAILSAVPAEGDGLGLVYLVVALILLAVFGPIAVLIGRVAKRHSRNGWAWGLLFFWQPDIVGIVYLIVRRSRHPHVATMS